MSLKQLLKTTFFVGICFLLFFFYNRGVILHDEGHILYATERIVQGEILYKNFHFLYTPLSAYITAFSFKLLGISIYSGRILALLWAWGTVYIIYLFMKSSFERISTLPILIATAMYIGWGPTHINFPYPVMFALTFGILFLFFLFKSIELGGKYWFGTGVSIALVFLSKQNFGLVTIPIFAFVLFTHKKSFKTKYKASLLTIFGLIVIFGLLGGYLLSTHSLYEFFYEAITFPITHFVGKNIMTTPFVYPGVWYRQIFRLAWYVTPLIVSSYGYLQTFKINSLKEKIKSRAIFLFVVLFYLFGIRPTTDYIHLVPLLATSGIGIATVIHFEKNKVRHFIITASAILFCFFGLATGLKYQYYRWETPLIRQNLFVNNTRVNVYVDQKYYQVITTLTREVNSLTSNKYIFVYYDRPLLYLILNKKNPTKYNDASYGMLAEKDEHEVIKNLKNRKVDLIITYDDFHRESKILEAYIENNFKKVKSVYEYVIWAKKR